MSSGSANKPTLLGLPTELQLQIINAFPKQSLTRFRLRQTCGLFRSYIPEVIHPKTVFASECQFKESKHISFNADKHVALHQSDSHSWRRQCRV
jgi:hypothetical protein